MMEYIRTNWFGIVTAAILVGAMLYGHRKGFLQTVLSLCSFLVAAWLSTVIFVAVAAAVPVGVVWKLVIFLLVFLLMRGMVHLLLKVTNLLSKLPVVHGLNQIAGALLGLLLGFLIVWFLFAILSNMQSVPWAEAAVQQVYGSTLLRRIFGVFGRSFP